MPTASAVVADLVAVALGTAQKTFEHLAVWPDRAAPAKQLPIEAVRSRYYLRVMAEDAPGVLAQVAAILGRHRISIRSVLQHEPLASSQAAAGVPVVITTHQAVEGNVRAALGEVDALSVIKAPSVCLGIVDEYPEPL
jgi:homoserine dehydrogenase